MWQQGAWSICGGGGVGGGQELPKTPQNRVKVTRKGREKGQRYGLDAYQIGVYAQ